MAAKKNSTTTPAEAQTKLNELDAFWAQFGGEGFEEVTSVAATTLKPGEHVEGVYEGMEVRNGTAQNGESKPFNVYLILQDDGTTFALGGAKILDSQFAAAKVTKGDRIIAARAPVDGPKKPGRSAPGLYKVWKKSSTN